MRVIYAAIAEHQLKDIMLLSYWAELLSAFTLDPFTMFCGNLSLPQGYRKESILYTLLPAICSFSFSGSVGMGSMGSWEPANL